MDNSTEYGMVAMESFQKGYDKAILDVRLIVEKIVREKKGFPVKLVDEEGYHLIRVIDLEKELDKL